MNRTAKQTVTKRLDPVKTRTAILKASFHTFAEKGYSGASIADIASTAGVPKSLVQYHFGTKEELFQACIASRAAPLVAVLDRFLQGEAEIEELVTTRFRLLQTDPDIGRLLAWASLSPTPVPAVMANRRTRFVERFGGNHSDPQFLRLLFVVAALDGWFLFRNLYKNLAGDAVLEKTVEDQLLQILLEMANVKGGAP